MKKSSEAVYKHFENRGLSHRFWEKFVVPNVKIVKGNKCEKCGSTEKLDVHHTDYNVQTIHTLLLLCEECHYNWHRENKPKQIDGQMKQQIVYPEGMPWFNDTKKQILTHNGSYQNINAKEGNGGA